MTFIPVSICTADCFKTFKRAKNIHTRVNLIPSAYRTFYTRIDISYGAEYFIRRWNIHMRIETKFIRASKFWNERHGIRPALDFHFPESLGVFIIAEPRRFFPESAFSVIATIIGKKSDKGIAVNQKDSSHVLIL